MECLAGADNKFGPAVKCSNQFDFTLLFEQSFFQIAPSAVLLLILPLRTSQLLRQHVKTKRTGIHAVKQTAIAVLAVTQLALLVAWSILPQASKASIPGAVLSLLASVALLFLSNLEHSRSVRPSSLINLYMLFQLILDLPQARTLWMRSGSLAVPSIFSIGLAVKAVVLYVEARSKRRSLLAPYLAHAPESLVNLYDRTVLFWLNSLFLLGYKSIISFEKLYEIEADLSSEILEQDFWVIWSKRESFMALDNIQLTTYRIHHEQKASSVGHGQHFQNDTTLYGRSQALLEWSEVVAAFAHQPGYDMDRREHRSAKHECGAWPNRSRCLHLYRIGNYESALPKAARSIYH